LVFDSLSLQQPTGRPLNYQGDGFEDSLDDELPPYILPNSPEVANWKKRNPSGWKQPSPSAAQVDTLLGHQSAIHNDASELERLAAKDQRLLYAKDRNGWQPIHEAARAGHKDAIEFLIKQGADVNSRTHNGAGVTPLHIAINAHSADHPVSQYLLGLGAVNLGPEL
jgi:prolyl 4-hydroxylase